MKKECMLQLVFFVCLGLSGCGNPNETKEGSESKKIEGQKSVEEPLIYTYSNRINSGAPAAIWKVLEKEIDSARKLVDHDDRMPFVDILKAADKKTQNFYQPYKSVLVNTKKIVSGADDSDISTRKESWLVPLYDNKRPITTWSFVEYDTDKWRVSVRGASQVHKYHEFEKSMGYWNSNYQKVLVLDATGEMRVRYVGYILPGNDLTNGKYHLDSRNMMENTKPVTWSEVLDQLSIDSETKRRRMEKSRLLRFNKGEKMVNHNDD
jgi:hypothetical protein